MKTNALKKAFTALAVSAVAVSTVSLSAFATADNGFSDAEISAATYKPVLTIDKVTLTMDQAEEHIKNNTPVTINYTISGLGPVDNDGVGKYSATGMHTYFDSRLTYPKKRNAPDVSVGAGADGLSVIARGFGNDCIFTTTSGDGNWGADGVMLTFQYYIPADAQPGDHYEIKVNYASSDDAEDRFTNAANDMNGRLMQAYFFTIGTVEPGYIEIEEPVETTTTPEPETSTTTTQPETTTTTTTPAPETTSTSTTKPETTTTTTKPETTTTTTTPAPETSTTTTSGDLDNGDGNNTKSTQSGEQRPGDDDNNRDGGTTTTASGNGNGGNNNNNNNSNGNNSNGSSSSSKNSSSSSSPKTGVAGIGVAAAGLAVAVGTAFVLRKKND